jgi:broad specificity phosphatase PhoE
MLGRHLADEKTALDAIYSGGLNRQIQTARIAIESMRESDCESPDPVIDERWNEFSLAEVYRGIAPRLIEASEHFALDYRQMQLDLIADPHATRGAAGRCDRAVIEAWMENRYPDYGGKTWIEFRDNARGGFSELAGGKPDGIIAIFTSATPIAIWAGAALELSNEKILRLMAVLYNSSITTLKIRGGELLLLSFNSTPHLNAPSLRTYR